MHNARVLVLEDDPKWIHTLRCVLDRMVGRFEAVTTVAEGLEQARRHYFNVVIVDLSMRLGDPKDTQGMAFLEKLQQEGLLEHMAPIILSAYGNQQRVREAFRRFQVDDFLDKNEFGTGESLKRAIREALERRHLLGHLEVRVVGGREEGESEGLDRLWRPMNWPHREEPEDLRAELYDLLRRLLPGATTVFLEPMQAGFSGARVVKAQPAYGANAGGPVVLKIGKRPSIAREQRNYREYVEPYVANLVSTQLDYVLGRVMGILKYRLIGTELGRLQNFGEYYRRHSAREICDLLDHLFRQTCRLWYDNREQPRQPRDVVALYEEALNIRWDEVRAGMAQIPEAHFDGDGIVFNGLSGRYPNPLAWLERHGFHIHMPVWRAMTHGDLNEYNILVTPEGQCILIDFYRTGYGHILRDVVELETVIKLRLTPVADLAAYMELERSLLDQTHLDRFPTIRRNHPHAKALHVLAHLRHLADLLTGQDSSMREYNLALLLQTLNLLRFDFMRAHHAKALLSAALLTEWLRQDEMA